MKNQASQLVVLFAQGSGWEWHRIQGQAGHAEVPRLGQTRVMAMVWPNDVCGYGSIWPLDVLNTINASMLQLRWLFFGIPFFERPSGMSTLELEIQWFWACASFVNRWALVTLSDHYAHKGNWNCKPYETAWRGGNPPAGRWVQGCGCYRLGGQKLSLQDRVTEKVSEKTSVDCTSSTAQGGGGSFKNRKPIREVGCCESGMAERSHWWTERCLRSPLFLSVSLSFSDYLPTCLLIYLSTYLSVCTSIYLPIYLCIYLPIYLAV